MSSWTLAELVEIAARVLAGSGVRVVSGRVADVPNERLVRWYSTIGLVDRPTIGRGRTARYGERHLAQVVAVKRLQAQGLPLVEIQQRLVGATDAELRRIAELPEDLAEWVVGHPSDNGGQSYLQNAPKAGPEPSEGNLAADLFARFAEPTPTPAPGAGVEASRTASAPREAVAPVDGARFWETRPSRMPVAPTPVFGVSLAGVTLLLPSQPNSDDLGAIASAAAPLIDLLASRSLLSPKGSHP